MSASSSVKTGIQARMNRIEQRDRVKQSKTRKPINLLRWVILIACVLFAILILSPLFLWCSMRSKRHKITHRTVR